MISIAICDDSQAVINHLDSLIQRYAKETNQDIKIYQYCSGIELLDTYTGNYDIIFMDIKMPNMDGLEAAERIRKRDRGVTIIFLTSLVRYALEGYKVEAFSFIIKPISYKRLFMELEAWSKKQAQDQEQPFLIVKNDNGSYRVLLKELTYIETSNRNILIHTIHANLICYKKLKEIESQLKGQGFARCHSSYIINQAYIKSVEKLDAKLITGEVIPISQTKRKEFMQGLARYWGGRL